MMQPRLHSVLAIFLVAALLPARLDAVTIHVPADQPTLLAALDAAAYGDIVELAPGEYTDVDTRFYFGLNYTAMGFVPAGVTVRSSGGAEVTTLRMPPGSGPLPFVLYAPEASDIVIQGLTLIQDEPVGWGIQGEVSTAIPGHLVVENCIFEGFPGTSTAIVAFDTELEVRGSEFRSVSGVAIDCTAPGLTLEDSQFLDIANAVFFVGETFAVRRCRLVGSVPGAPFGTALWAFDVGTCVIEECLVADFPLAARIRPRDGGTFSILQNTFIRAAVDLGSDALPFESGEVARNTLYGAETVAPLLIVAGAPTAGPTVHNNIVAFGGAQATALAASGLVSTACNAFWANAGGNRNGALDPTDFVADPLFCDPVTDNLYLLSDSPCLAANNPACGLVGALGIGCAPVSVETSSWGRTKSLFR